MPSRRGGPTRFSIEATVSCLLECDGCDFGCYPVEPFECCLDGDGDVVVALVLNPFVKFLRVDESAGDFTVNMMFFTLVGGGVDAAFEVDEFVGECDVAGASGEVPVEDDDGWGAVDDRGVCLDAGVVEVCSEDENVHGAEGPPAVHHPLILRPGYDNPRPKRAGRGRLPTVSTVL